MIGAHFIQVVAIITRPESRESFISNTFVFTFEVMVRGWRGCREGVVERVQRGCREGVEWV
jgi:hypothetical protein